MYFVVSSVSGGVAVLTVIVTGAVSFFLVEDVYKWIDEEFFLSVVFIKFEFFFGEVKIVYVKCISWS